MECLFENAPQFASSIIFRVTCKGFHAVSTVWLTHNFFNRKFINSEFIREKKNKQKLWNKVCADKQKYMNDLHCAEVMDNSKPPYLLSSKVFPPWMERAMFEAFQTGLSLIGPAFFLMLFFDFLPIADVPNLIC